ncbi:MAG TPA: DUF1963 domain-containing protein [Candidatus Obscuribacter sp.]|nr:DUF1963 domain-containing protein [Candidatus Obscuribacter sp.]HMY56101.1 DUF1963 domain-containing protein [Candidatus Obscuribacter sp.]HNB15837.1 DUF1963 domain-containing protein [Candidatus Obscuribacter sp.]
MSEENSKLKTLLKEELAAILTPYRAEGEKWAQALKATAGRSVVLVNERAAPGAEEDKLSRLFGKPLTSATFRWPRDRQGEAMLFLAQIDCKQLPPLPDYPRDGILAIFKSLTRESLTKGRESHSGALKDRQSFYLHYFPEDARGDLREREDGKCLPPKPLLAASTVFLSMERCQPLALPEGNDQLRAQLAAWTEKFNRLSLANVSGVVGPAYDSAELAEMKVIASFCASGIGYNLSRKTDRHYSHLVENAKEYEVVLVLKEGAGGLDDGGTGNTVTNYIAMRRQDLIEKRFDRAWLFSAT